MIDDLGMYEIQQLARGERSAEGVTAWVHPKTIGNDIIWTSLGGPILVTQQGRNKLDSSGASGLSYKSIVAFSAETLTEVPGLLLVSFPVAHHWLSEDGIWIDGYSISFPRVGAALAQRLTALDFVDVDLLPLRFKTYHPDFEPTNWRWPTNGTVLEIIESVAPTIGGKYQEHVPLDRSEFRRKSPPGVYWVSHTDVIDWLSGQLERGNLEEEFEGLCEILNNFVSASEMVPQNDVLVVEEFVGTFRWICERKARNVPGQILRLEAACADARALQQKRYKEARLKLLDDQHLSTSKPAPVLDHIRRPGRPIRTSTIPRLWTIWDSLDQQVSGCLLDYDNVKLASVEHDDLIAHVNVRTLDHLICPFLFIRDAPVDALAISRYVLNEMFPMLVEESSPVTVVLPDGSLIDSFSLLTPSGRYVVDRTLGSLLDPRSGFGISDGDCWVAEEPGQGRFLVSERVANLINEECRTGGLAPIAEPIGPWAEGGQTSLQSGLL